MKLNRNLVLRRCTGRRLTDTTRCSETKAIRPLVTLGVSSFSRMAQERRSTRHSARSAMVHWLLLSPEEFSHVFTYFQYMFTSFHPWPSPKQWKFDRFSSPHSQRAHQWSWQDLERVIHKKENAFRGTDAPCPQPLSTRRSPRPWLSA